MTVLIAKREDIQQLVLLVSIVRLELMLMPKEVLAVPIVRRELILQRWRLRAMKFVWRVQKEKKAPKVPLVKKLVSRVNPELILRVGRRASLARLGVIQIFLMPIPVLYVR